MTHHNDSHDDLQPVVEQLRASRPEASALELDMVKQRVRARVSGPGRRARSANPMKSRLTILATLVVGMLMSTTGASLAISGFASSSDDASVAQYGRETPDNDVLGEEDTGGGGGENGVLGEGEAGGGNGGDTAPEALQPTRQAEAGAQSDGSELPFTGFAAIPILLGGVALLSAGLVLRRRSDDGSPS